MRHVLLISTCFALHSSAQSVEVSLSAPNASYPANTTVVSAPWPAGVSEEQQSVWLANVEGVRIPAQRSEDSEAQLVWLLETPLAKGESRTYRVVEDAVETDAMATCSEEVDDCFIKVQDKPVLRYNVSLKECPVEGFAECRRSGFIHPLYAPDGTVVSDDFPPEHAHQHGIMFAWTHSTFHGREVDFWNSMKKLGITEHAEVLSCTSGPVFAELRVKIDHVALAEKGERQPALDEVWRVRVFNCADPFVIELQSTQTTATDEPLVLPEYHYGGMAFRGARPWSFGKAEFLTSLGGDRESGNHTRPLWTAITGEIEGKPYAFVGAGYPQNFRHPQPVRLHPDMPYFCWAPEVLGEFTIAPGDVYRSAYRFLVQQGKPEVDALDTWQAALADPPRGEVVR